MFEYYPMAKAEQAGELLHCSEVLPLVRHAAFARSWCSDQVPLGCQ